MDGIKDLLHDLFAALNDRVEELVLERREDGMPSLPKSTVRILGQMSLLAQEKASVVLTLARTADLDAFLTMDHVVKVEMKRLLEKQGLVYDEDSYLIWIPPGAHFDRLFDFKHILVEVLDPESALLSKAIKAPAKNRQLIRQAMVSGQFPHLAEKIGKLGGKLEEFA